MKHEKAEREEVPVGMHTGIMYAVVDQGTQKPNFADGNNDPRPEMRLVWELPDCPLSDGRPMVIDKTYNMRLTDNSNYVADMKAWTGIDPRDRPDAEAFLRDLLGRGCNLNVILNKNGRPKVSSVAPLKKSEVTPPPVNPLVFVNLDNFDPAEFAKLPEWLQKIVQASPEYLEATGQGKAEGYHGKQQEVAAPAGHPAFDEPEF